MGKRDREVAKMRRPPKGETWVHVSSLEDQSGNVWAVQHEGVYSEVAHVVMLARTFTRFYGRSSKKQPRAVIVAMDAAVTVRGKIAYIEQAG